MNIASVPYLALLAACVFGIWVIPSLLEYTLRKRGLDARTRPAIAAAILVSLIALAAVMLCLVLTGYTLGELTAFATDVRTAKILILGTAITGWIVGVWFSQKIKARAR